VLVAGFGVSRKRYSYILIEKHPWVAAQPLVARPRVSQCHCRKCSP